MFDKAHINLKLDTLQFVEPIGGDAGARCPQLAWVPLIDKFVKRYKIQNINRFEKLYLLFC